MEGVVRELRMQIASKDECYEDAQRKLVQERDALK